MWNTILGEPVLGPLVGKGIELTRLSVVTTTWGKWKELHPETTVLSLQTGHYRDYAEGAAYRDYFATDNLMFNVPFADKRLANKAEILALQSPDKKSPPVAISSEFLKKNPIYRVEVSGAKYLVLTDSSGAHRVYEDDGTEFNAWDGDSALADKQGQSWKLTETGLEGGSKTLARISSHNAFWFGWHAAYPDTKLIK